MKTIEYPGSAAPLLGWDFFMASYQRLSALADDLRLLKELEEKQGWQHNLNFQQQLLQNGDTILVTDPRLRIVYASSNMIDMNGYLLHEVAGKTPKIFQGPKTLESHRQIIRQAIDNQQPFEATLVNYLKNGEEYDCHVKGFPMFNSHKQLVNFVAFERRA